MTWKLVVGGLLVLGVTGAAPVGPPATPPAGPAPEAAPPRPVERVKFEWLCSGPVLAVAKDSITVEGFDAISVGGVGLKDLPTEKWGERITIGKPVKLWRPDGSLFVGVRLVGNREGHALFGGNGEVVTRAMRADQPPRKFPLRGPLATGSYVPTGGSPDSYRIQDVEVGDWVSLKYVRIGDVDYVERIEIKRRPGGRVPVAPRDLEDHTRLPRHIFHHEQMNAEQDWEERGTPIPEKFVKYLSGRLSERYPPVAPQPRPAKP